MSAPPAVRPLPPRPSLEYEKKEAKRLLRRLRAGDPDALARARQRHDPLATRAPEEFQLADAQLVIAREYGFASWPRLVRYFGDAERQGLQIHARRYVSHPRQLYESQVRRFRAELREREPFVVRSLAAFVPRFYGMRVEEVVAEEVTDDELRLAVARHSGCPSWDVLMERVDADAARHRNRDQWEVGPGERAVRAIRAADLDALRRVTEAHPELLRDAKDDTELPANLLSTALHAEREQGAAAMRPILEWLGAQGFDLQRTLNVLLCGYMGMEPETVRWLLDRGADPNWVAPNGVPVLEHALLRYWNVAAVDVLAPRATPRDALWIAAGLGDVDGVRRFLDRSGRPTTAARRLRPDFGLMTFSSALPSLPDPDDEEIFFETLLVAALNERASVIEYLGARVAPVNSLLWGKPLIDLAIGNAWVGAVEGLVRAGADLDLRAPGQRHSARELAWGLFEEQPEAPGRRRIAELCGLDPEAILAARNARPVPEPVARPEYERALALAADDARRQGQTEVRPENLLFGLLRGDELSITFFARVSRMDFERFRTDFEERMRPTDADAADVESLPLDAEAQAAVDAAWALAREQRRDMLMGGHLLHALVRTGRGPAVDLLTRYGGDVAVVKAELERAL